MQVFVLCYILYMRLHRFYLENIENKEIFTEETDLIHQLKNVFRYKTGQKLFLFNEKDGEIEVEISNINKKDVSFRYIRHIRSNKEKEKYVVLYMSIIKNSNFDFLLEKAVELGIKKIIPIITERTVKSKLNYDRLNKIIKESTEQSGRIDLLKIENTIDFENAVVDIKNKDGFKCFGHIGIKSNIKDLLGIKDNCRYIFIGPEGGFSDNEIRFMIDNNIKPLCINDNVLRAETAAIAFSNLMSL